MATSRFRRLASGTALCLLMPVGPMAGLAFAQAVETVEEGETVVLDTIVLSAEDQGKQALGTSTIGAADIEKTPVVNDVSEIIRKMPGVNLTGTSPSGQRGNQRQIDIRGMGPENTLILIDGKPVMSRTSVKMGRSGERDTRGDSNWVPAELIERIEVIRGPAAARYGSGAAGGVVNIITKRPDHDLFSIGVNYNRPESSLEGTGARVNMLWAKRLGDNLGLRLTGNYNRTNPSDPARNAPTVAGETCYSGTTEVACTYDAGNEGVVNKDLTASLTWEPDDRNRFDFDLGFSRQGNIYAGDTQLGSDLSNGGETLIDQLARDGAETNVMRRTTAAVTHTGDYAWGMTKSYVQYEHTNNTRLIEGTAGSSEGSINTEAGWDRAYLDAWSAKSEATLEQPLFGKPSAITFGAEVRSERLDLSDYTATALGFDWDDISAAPEDNDPISRQTTVGFYAEANIEWTEKLMLTPSVRVDWADTYGANLSGGLSATYAINDAWTVKGGVARAFKSPNLYQLSERYVYGTRGNGCPYLSDGTRLSNCRVLGNPDLDPETSINTEIGVAYSGLNGIEATLTYFHNDYHDKIQAGTQRVGTMTVGTTVYNVFKWTNIPDAVVSGLEGSFAADLSDTIRLSVNGTYMIDSEQELTTQAGDKITVPLSLVPKYTINAALDWRATERLTVTPSLTHYGKTEAPLYTATTGVANDDLVDRGGYTMINLAVNYDFDDDLRLGAGVTNLFNKQILRSGDGAETYNEPGRAFYVSLNKTF
ncbi:MAG: FepA family TonB-dependent siderophore receptor [Paracoccaceae bacterium]